MKFFNPIKISYKNLMAAKGRSFLTILGIIIGVAAVIVIMALGLSAQALILDQVQGIGSNLIGILPGASDEKGPPTSVMGITTPTLTYDDLKSLRNENNVPEVEDGAGYVLGTASVSWGGEEYNYSFTGTTASYLDVESGELESGRFFVEQEESNLARVVVLGKKVADDMFENNDPLNERIKIKDQTFTVIGVMKERGSAAFGMASYDEQIYVPLKTAQKLLLGINHLGFVRLKAKDRTQIFAAMENIKKVLRDRHDISDPANDDFTVRDQASALESIGKVTDILRYFMLSVGAISLVVGGVGIMNIMLIAVNQRIREIGLRKAVGAKNMDVVWQFLVEAATVSFVGGIIGIILGILVSFLVSIIVQALGYDWQFIISYQSILVAVAISILIGIIFGIYPAGRAAKISPMEALRYE